MTASVQLIRRLLLGAGWLELGCSGGSPTPPSDQPPAVATVTVSPSSPSLQVGDSIRLSATAQDSNGSVLSGVEISWSSSDSAVTTVSAAGVVRAVSGGSAAVIATAEGVSGEANVSVLAPAVECSGLSYTRLILVSTASQLSSAITNARPGDLIQLAPGTYTGRWTLSTSGSPSAPIILCGSRGAILDGEGTTPAPITLTVRASYWTIQGFTIRNAFQGLFLIGAHGVTVKGLEIYDIGLEAIALNHTAQNNLIDGNYIHDTGKNNPLYGEGVYIGTANHRWVNGVPDRSDNNTVSNNTLGPNITSEPIDVKEGTTGTMVTGNNIDRTGKYSGSGASIFIIGNNAQVTRNVITNVSGTDNGMYVETLRTGWGQNNVFAENTVTGTRVTGYGFLVGAGSQATTTIRCNNVATGLSGGLSNITCTP